MMIFVGNIVLVHSVFDIAEVAYNDKFAAVEQQRPDR